MRAFLFSVVLVAACGGSKKAPAEEHMQMESEEASLTPELRDFHDVLAPLWHSTAETRQADTCSAAPQMVDLATKVQAAAVPAGAADDWDLRAQALFDSTSALQDTCAAEGESFDDTFAKVHQSFHWIMEALPQ